MVYIASYLLLFIFFCVKDIRYATALFGASLFIVPSGMMIYSFGGINILVCEIIILLFAINYKYCGFVKTVIVGHQRFWALISFLFLSFVLFSSVVPIVSQIKSYVAEFLYYFFVVALFCYIKHCFDSKYLLVNAIVFAIIINVLFSLVFEIVLGNNPTSDIVNSLYNDEVAIDMLSESRGGFGFRVQSIFGHPLSLGQIMLLAIPLVIYSETKYLNWLIFVMFLLILLSGTRGAIFPALILLLFYYGQKVNPRNTLLIIFGVVFFWFASSSSIRKEIVQNYDMALTLVAFWDNNRAEEVRGSSLSMRFEQFDAALEEIRDNYLFGKGKGYREYYQKLHGGHPKLLGYESLILLVLVERGVVGLILYIYCLYYISFRLFKINSKDRFYVLSFFMFLLSAIMTGIREYYILLFGLNSIVYYRSIVYNRIRKNSVKSV